jgi:hyperosmotically inducible protein
MTPGGGGPEKTPANRLEEKTAMSPKVFGRTLILAVLVTVPALAQEARRNDEVFKDTSRAVLSYSNFTIFDDVRAVVQDGAVTLKGKVTMPFKRDDIGRRVARVAGVTRVDNQIEVLPVSQFDEELRYSVAHAIYGSAAFWPYASMANPPIHVIVDRGRVTLTGVVGNEVDRVLARSLASNMGAFSVTSELKTDAEMRALLEGRTQ